VTPRLVRWGRTIDVGPTKKMHVQAGREEQLVDVGTETSTQTQLRHVRALAGGDQVGRLNGKVRQFGHRATRTPGPLAPVTTALECGDYVDVLVVNAEGGIFLGTNPNGRSRRSACRAGVLLTLKLLDKSGVEEMVAEIDVEACRAYAAQPSK